MFYSGELVVENLNLWITQNQASTFVIEVTLANQGFVLFSFVSGRFIYGTISVRGHVAELLGVGAHLQEWQYYLMEDNSLGRKLRYIVK